LRSAHFGSVEIGLLNLDEPDKNPVRWSDEIYRIFGYQPGVVRPTRRAFFEIVHPEDSEPVRKALDSALHDTKPYTIDFRIIRPDGTERNIHERGDIIFDPNTHKPVKLVASVQDVTERVQAEIRLQQANMELGARVQELQQRSTEIQLLSEMGSRLQSCRETSEAYIEISNSAGQLFPKWAGSLCVTSASRTSVETVADWGSAAHAEHVYTPDDCWALRRGQPQAYRRGGRISPCRHIDPANVTESLCVPLMAQGEALGILNLQRTESSPALESSTRWMDEAEQRLAGVLAEQVALALGNLRLRESLKNQSICDSLTGLFNRRYLEESLEREFSRASRNKTSVAFLMMDLDHFKRFNDTFGHHAGDTLLRALGDLMKRSTRGQDIACRYGGEEFAIVLTDSSPSGAMRRAESLRREVKEMSVEYAGQLLGSVTISIGVAIFPDHGTTISEIQRASDQALYSAKREGRDRVYVSTVESLA